MQGRDQKDRRQAGQRELCCQGAARSGRGKSRTARGFRGNHAQAAGGPKAGRRDLTAKGFGRPVRGMSVTVGDLSIVGFGAASRHRPWLLPRWRWDPRLVVRTGESTTVVVAR